jgi:hypothetical protein
MAQLYLSAYVTGWAFAAAYNGLVFVLLVRLGRQRLRLSFAYHAYDNQGHNIPFNIIKSPIRDPVPEETQPEGSLGIPRLYDFNPQPPPRAPYTIAFIANPRIPGNQPNALERDPIVDDLDLFLHTVDRALQSFERDEVLGAAEIWSRARVVTFFDPDWNQVLVQQISLPLSGGINDNFLDTVPNVAPLFFARPGLPIPLQQFDVIFVLSAWRVNCRSTARFSDFLDGVPQTWPGPQVGPPFVFHGHPLLHDHYAIMPGRVALSVFGARAKTFIHEFAHAMSSVNNGAIADEYYDPFARPGPAPVGGPVCINRLQRPAIPPGAFMVPVPEDFAPYQSIGAPIRVFSDMGHPSAEENWQSFFPELIEPGFPCTMDRSAGRHRFDRLISYFMYHRICAKHNRP